MKSLVKLFLFTSLIVMGLAKEKHKEEIEEDYEVYVDEIIYDFSKDVSQKYQLRCMGSGGSMPHDVVRIRILFYKNQDFESIEEARKTLIELVDLLTQKVHQHKKIQPFLHERPFPISGSGISISIENKERNNNQPTDKLVFVFQASGKLHYRTYDGRNLVNKLEETYEEAVKKNQEYLKRKERGDSFPES